MWNFFCFSSLIKLFSLIHWITVKSYLYFLLCVHHGTAFCSEFILSPTKSFLFSTLLSLNILFLHQICIPLIKLNYFWLPNILCRWLSTENTWLWTSNDTVSLKHELQPSRRHLQANYRPLLQNRAEIKCWFLFLQLLTSTQ